jgi:hypothetical protein
MEEEYIDVHEGGREYWLQKIADHIKLRGFRYEAHGDNIRIILERGVTIDFGSEPEGLCFYSRVVLPSGDDHDEINDYISDISIFIKIASIMPRPVSYVVDESMSDYKILNMKRCFKSFEEVINVIDRLYDHFSQEGRNTSE